MLYKTKVLYLNGSLLAAYSIDIGDTTPAEEFEGNNHIDEY